jgi:hypothetical protein
MDTGKREGVTDDNTKENVSGDVSVKISVWPIFRSRESSII